MEKAVLRTLAYSNIFDYPLKAWEIQKWLIGQNLTLRQVEKTLQKLGQKKLIKTQSGLYFLSKRSGLVNKKITREVQSKKLINQAKLLTFSLKYLPGIKLVGISGALAMNNAQVDDDIDLFIITAKNRLWLIRFLTLIVLTLVAKRRLPTDSRQSAAGKFCLNTILEDDQLAQQQHDLYTAHEVLQMRVLWQKEDTYTNFLFANQWAFKFLPNWIGSERFEKPPVKKATLNNWLDLLNQVAKNLQQKYMRPIQGSERISQGSVYFHPKDYRSEILKEYKESLTSLDI